MIKSEIKNLENRVCRELNYYAEIEEPNKNKGIEFCKMRFHQVIGGAKRGSGFQKSKDRERVTGQRGNY
ncbi:MAG: hypothetical protein ABH836_07080 [Candidatus Omnitrophota bacterium]